MLCRAIVTAFQKSLHNIKKHCVAESKVKERDRGNVRFPPPSAEIKNTRISTANPPYVLLMCWLIKYRDI
jgi:hypothetical protein